MRSLSIALFLVACGSSNNTAIDAPKSSIDAPRSIDAPATAIDAAMADAPADQMVTLVGGANALLWDDAASTLYLTDGSAMTNGTLLAYTTAIATVGTWPADSAGVSLGGLAKQADGSILCANFGFATMGSLFSMTTAGVATNLTGFDVTRRRIALAKDSAGVLYEGYFTGGGGNPQVGGVASVTFAGTVATETEIVGAAAALKKVVGVAATTTNLYISDQTQKMIFKYPLPSGPIATLATVTTADLLVMLPNGDMLTGGGATIERITQAGIVTVVPTPTFSQVHGIAYDPTGHRLFVIDHSTVAGTPDVLHILPFSG